MIQMHWKHLAWWLAGREFNKYWLLPNLFCNCSRLLLHPQRRARKFSSSLNPELLLSSLWNCLFRPLSHLECIALCMFLEPHFGVQMIEQREEGNGCRQSFYWDICYSQLEMPWPQASPSETPPKKLEVTEKSDREVAAKSAFLHPSFKEGSQSSREGSCLARVWANLGAAHCLALTTTVRQVCWMLPHAHSYCILNSRPMGEPQVPIYLQPCLLCCDSTERRIWLP